MPRVHVVIAWPEDVRPLPDTARARVTIEDVSRADAESRVLGETILRNVSTASSAVAKVAVGDVDPRADIVARVHVSRAGRPAPPVAPGDLLTTQSYPVLTHGHGDSVVVVPTVVGS